MSFCSFYYESSLVRQLSMYGLAGLASQPERAQAGGSFAGLRQVLRHMEKRIWTYDC